MRVLLVAPRTDLLLVNDEVEDVQRSGLEVTPLTRSKVTADDLVREIRASTYDVLWLSTHGGEYVKETGELLRDVKLSELPPNHETDYGIKLSDGMMSMSELCAIVRDRFRLVVLNTCDSVQIAQLLQEEGNVSVVCTIVAVPDRQAYLTGSLFAAALADTANIATAYRRAKPGGNRVYLYLAALEPSADSLDSLVQKIMELTKKVEQDAAVGEQVLAFYRRWFWVSMVLHGIELPALVVMAWQLMHQGG